MRPISAVFFASLLPMLVACSDKPDVAEQQTTETESPAFAETDGVQSAVSIPAESMRSDIRPEVGGMRAAVVSEQPLASQIGYEALRNGGNALDAVVSMAAALAVVRPHMNSVGGDSFALFYDAKTGEVTAMKASGRAGTLATPEFYSAQDLARMPFSGALSITVPGTVSAWEAAPERFGSLTMAQALAPAIDIAETSFMVTSTFAADAKESAPEMNDAGRAIYYPGDQPLKEGDLLKSADLAMSLRIIAEQGAGF